MPTEADDITHARRAVRQQAETAAMLGVDFVPCFRTGAGIAEVAAPSVAVAAGDDPERAAARQAMDKLRARYEADGDVCARLMFIGEAPGADEDATGVPFVGRAGQLLDKMITAMGLRREEVYIANVLKTRPPNNATPTVDEATLCEPYLHEQIAIVRPEVIVTLGLPASRLILGSTESMGQMRGRWAEYVGPGVDGPRVAVMPTYHPAFLLRSYTPDNRKKVWADLQMVVAKLAGG